MQTHHSSKNAPVQKGAAKDLITSFDANGVVVREADWGSLNVSFQRFPAGFDLTPLLRGLPHDRCQCPHWGYVTKGRMIVSQSGIPDVAVGPGEAYYAPPGHTIRFTEETELLELSPPAELAKTMAVIGANLERSR